MSKLKRFLSRDARSVLDPSVIEEEDEWIDSLFSDYVNPEIWDSVQAIKDKEDLDDVVLNDLW